MQAIMVGMLAEVPLHPGTGQSVGAIDLPVQRESTTKYPVLVGSSLKGALRDYAEQEGHPDSQINEIFGLPDQIGSLGVTDGKLLLLPLRALHQAYAWVTCPYALERLKRDLAFAGQLISWEIPTVADQEAITASCDPGQSVFLEEYVYTATAPSDQWSAITATLASLLHHSSTRARLSQQLTIISNDEFAHFAEYGLPVRARNKLDENKTSKALWYEESLPTDTVLYFLFISRSDENPALTLLQEWLATQPYLQVGGNESVGQGWCVLQVYPNEVL